MSKLKWLLVDLLKISLAAASPSLLCACASAARRTSAQAVCIEEAEGRVARDSVAERSVNSCGAGRQGLVGVMWEADVGAGRVLVYGV